jgi:uncharacterized protein YbbK (DUF523 family)
MRGTHASEGQRFDGQHLNARIVPLDHSAAATPACPAMQLGHSLPDEETILCEV